MTFRSLFCFLASFTALVMSLHAFGADSQTELNAQTAIVERLNKWPQDFNSKNLRGVCDLFAPDLVASYPGTKDRNYEEMCRQLTSALTDPEKILHYDAPNIEQIIIEGDLAVVRLIWTLKSSSKNKPEVETIKEKGLDLFKRQKDGSWKIVISYAYPL